MNSQSINVIVTGASGMVGEGVLNECLHHPSVGSVLVVGRRPCGVQHPKMKEVLIDDFFKTERIRDDLQDYQACFFCLGVSSIGKKEDEYRRLTYDLTLGFAKTFLSVSPDSVFCYVSGSGTDSSEKGKSMWARIKGKTENDLAKLSFKKTFLFRPGYIHPTPGLRNTLSMYRYVTWAYPFWRKFFPGFVSTLREVGLAMVHVALREFDKTILEVPDINACAKAEEIYLQQLPTIKDSDSNQEVVSGGVLPNRDLKKNLGCG